MIVEDSLPPIRCLIIREYDTPKRIGASISAFTIYDLSKSLLSLHIVNPFWNAIYLSHGVDKDLHFS
jgi:hypothetical protein